MPSFSLRIAAILERWPLPRFWREHLADCIRAYIMDGAEIGFRHIIGVVRLPKRETGTWRLGLATEPQERAGG